MLPVFLSLYSFLNHIVRVSFLLKIKQKELYVMMKFKTLFLIPALVLAFILGSFGYVYASPSPERLVNITSCVDKDGNPVHLNESDVPGGIPALTVILAEELNGREDDNAGALTILWQRELTASKLPAVITFNAIGTENCMLYIYHYNGTEWEFLGKGQGPSITQEFTSLSPVAIAVRAGNPANTGDNSHLILWVSLMLMAGSVSIGLFFFGRKKHRTVR
jgi:hypothetical protein